MSHAVSHVVVHNKREGFVYGPRSSGGAVVFKPGANEVPQAYLEGLDEHGIHALETLFQDGYLSADLAEELAPAAGADPGPAPVGLPADDAAALAAVLAEGDRKVLSGWLEHEQRENVFDALVDKLSKLDGGSPLQA